MPGQESPRTVVESPGSSATCRSSKERRPELERRRGGLSRQATPQEPPRSAQFLRPSAGRPKKSGQFSFVLTSGLRAGTPIRGRCAGQRTARRRGSSRSVPASATIARRGAGGPQTTRVLPGMEPKRRGLPRVGGRVRFVGAVTLPSLALLVLLERVGLFVPFALAIAILVLGRTVANPRFGLTATIVAVLLIPIPLNFR